MVGTLRDPTAPDQPLGLTQSLLRIGQMRAEAHELLGKHRQRRWLAV